MNEGDRVMVEFKQHGPFHKVFGLYGRFGGIIKKVTPIEHTTGVRYNVSFDTPDIKDRDVPLSFLERDVQYYREERFKELLDK